MKLFCNNGVPDQCVFIPAMTQLSALPKRRYGHNGCRPWMLSMKVWANHDTTRS